MWKVVVVLVLAGCAPTTQEDGCFSLTTAICEKDKSCGAVEDVNRCRTALIPICCGSGSCSRLIGRRDGEKFLECEAAYRAASCAQILGGTSPQACAGD